MDSNTLLQEEQQKRILEQREETKIQQPLQQFQEPVVQTLHQPVAVVEPMVIQPQINVTLQRNLQQSMPLANATQTATGSPEQIEAPAKQTRKEKKEQARRDQEAKKVNPLADHVSYDLVVDLKQLESERKNSASREYMQSAASKNVDTRVLRSYIQGYKTDKKGRPATPEDERKMIEDREFLEAYISKDITRRKPYLDKITQELLDEPLTPDMLTPPYMQKNAVKMKRLADKMTYYENVYQDPVNKPYFDNMPKLTKGLIQARILDMYAAVGVSLINSLALKAVHCDVGDYSKESEVVNAAQEAIDYMAENRIVENAFEESRLDEVTAINECINETPQPVTEIGTMGGEETKIAMRKLYTDSQVREKADLGYARDENLALKKSYAFQALGIRSSGTEMAQADKLVRGSTYLKFPDDLIMYFHSLEDGGTDLAMIDAKSEVAYKKYTQGIGLDSITKNQFSMFSSYLTNPESIQYIDFTCDLFKEAAVFGGDLKEMVKFVLQCLINSYGANVSYVAANINSFKNPAAVRAVAVKSCNNLMYLPVMLELSEAEKNALPDAAKEMLAQYEMLINSLADKVSQRRLPPPEDDFSLG